MSKIAHEYNIGKSTISGIYKSLPSLTPFKSSLVNESNTKKRKTMKQAANEDLDKAVCCGSFRSAAKDFQ